MEPLRVPAAILRPKPAFIQFLNREILSLHGQSAPLGSQGLYRWALRLTRYALFVARDSIVLPASYLFEVPFIDSYLARLHPLGTAGLLRVASSTADLSTYAKKKRREYREELSLFPEYEDAEHQDLGLKDISWAPRVGRSAFGDISTAWRRELNEEGLWTSVLAARSGRFAPLTKWETQIAKVPRLLDGKAFVTRYATPILPFELTTGERSAVGLLVSRAYLESYLLELGAFIINRTPLGDLDCGLPPVGPDGSILAFSYVEVARLLDFLGVREAFERTLGWRQFLRLLGDPVVRWLAEAVILNAVDLRRPLDASIREADLRPSQRLMTRSGSRALEAILERVHVLYGHVGDWMSDAFSELANAGSDRKESRDRDTSILIVESNQEAVVNQNDVFLVHGRDNTATGCVKAILRAAGVNPVDWEQAVGWTGKASPMTLEVIQEGLARTQAILLLFTPDESVQLRGELASSSDPEYETSEGYQARPNVLIEAGMAFALNPDRTLILQIGAARPISNLAGLNYVRFDGSAGDRQALLGRLENAGCRPTPTRDFFELPFEFTEP